MRKNNIDPKEFLVEAGRKGGTQKWINFRKDCESRVIDFEEVKSDLGRGMAADKLKKHGSEGVSEINKKAGKKGIAGLRLSVTAQGMSFSDHMRTVGVSGGMTSEASLFIKKRAFREPRRRGRRNVSIQVYQMRLYCIRGRQREQVGEGKCKKSDASYMLG